MPGWVERAWRGRDDDPTWARPALLVLLVATFALYAWNLSASGWANSFYSSAAQAGSESWKAFFFGSSDAAGSITVDKPPLALWPMALSVRIFGLSSWSLLLPQALMGVATVGVLHATVRRWASAGAALLAGAVLALTPVAALMFRFNNPDALLTLLMVVAAYTALRGIEDGRTRWFVLTGVAIGLGFLTKQLQVLLVVPGFAVAYLLAGQASIPRRLRDLAVAGVAMVASAGWWILAVELWPASSRPYIGGSQENSILELTLGYNGLGRLTGDETGSVGGGGGPGGGGGGMWGQTGITRMFDGVIGGQIAWLLPAALVLLGVGLWVTRRAARSDMARASLVVWGAWLLVTGLTFSFMAGIFHEYYTVALAPAVGALVGIGAGLLWKRGDLLGRAVLSGVVVLTAVWAAVLLGRASDWNPWLSPLVVAGGLVAALALVVTALPEQWTGGLGLARWSGAAAILAVTVVLLGPAAWSLQTASTGQEGSIVTAGPAVSGSTGGPGGAGVPGGAGAFPGGAGGFPGAQGQTGQTFTPPTGATGQGGFPGGGPGGAGGGGMGGLLGGTEVSDDLAAVLTEDADAYTWIAATTGSQNASSYQLATEESVMPIGGFNGSDPSPTLEQFQAYVAAGDVHWYLESGLSGQGSMGGSDAAQEIATWVEQTFEAQTVDGVTLYDLSGGAATTT
jgi:4-amino-4-deoxy-L-arabinose transferase-like glycosyltransferase